jgi:hypothetical protein
MSKTAVSALLALCCIPLAATAQYPASSSTPTYGSRYADLSYTFGEVRLLAEDPDGGDDAKGVRVGGSLLMHPDFFAVAALSTLGSSGNNGVDTDTLEFGIGYRHAISPRLDLLGIGALVWEDRDHTAPQADDDDLGVQITGGARAVLTPVIEVGGYLSYVHLFGDGDLGLRGEGLYHFTPNFSALAGVGLSDDVREASLGVRWSFQPTR